MPFNVFAYKAFSIIQDTLLDLLTKAKIPPKPAVVSAEKQVCRWKNTAFAILLRFRAMAERRHSSVAARMPLFQIFEIQCSRFKTEKLPSAQILRSHIMDRNSGVLTCWCLPVKCWIAAAGQYLAPNSSLVKTVESFVTVHIGIALHLIATQIFPGRLIAI